MKWIPLAQRKCVKTKALDLSVLLPSEPDAKTPCKLAQTAAQKGRDHVSSVHGNREADHWFIAPARLEMSRVPSGAKRLGFAATFPQDVSNAPGRVLERFELTKGSGA